MYLTYSNQPKIEDKNETVKNVQKLLNKIRINLPNDKKNHHAIAAWKYLDEDGLFGRETRNAIEAFQRAFFESNSSYKELGLQNFYSRSSTYGIIDDQTYQAIVEVEKWCTTKKSILANKSTLSAKRKIELGTSIILNIKEIEGCAQEILQILDKSKYFVLQILDMRFKGAKSAIIKEVNNSIKSLKQLGISHSKMIELQEASYAKDIRDCLKLISNSTDSKWAKTLRITASSIKAILKPFQPLIKLLNKIPGVQYTLVFEKMVSGTIAFFLYDDVDKMWGDYFDAVRLLFEQLVVDSLIPFGLIPAIVASIIFAIIEYFYFSENSGDTLVDKHSPLTTHNYTKDFVNMTDTNTKIQIIKSVSTSSVLMPIAPNSILSMAFAIHARQIKSK